MTDLPLLTILTLLPVTAGIVLLGFHVDQRRASFSVGLLTSALTAVITAFLCWKFDTSNPDYQFSERYNWIPQLGIQYLLGLDGPGLMMIILTCLIYPLAFMAAFKQQATPTFYALLLFLKSGLFGTFTALNFVHWFLFWELSLIPVFFLIKLYGDVNRSRAAFYFFLYTMAGSVFMLLAFLGLYQATATFEFSRLSEMARSGELSSALTIRLAWYHLTTEELGLILFFGVFIGLAVKVPLWPFHSWLPLTYSQAPTPVTLLLTALMSKMGLFGFIRIVLPIFPEQMRLMSGWLLSMAVVTILWGALVALAQRDLKSVLAYSSINHLGYAMLGVFAAVLQPNSELNFTADKSALLAGVLWQMFSHGLIAAALFCLLAFVEARSGSFTSLVGYGGLRQKAPWLFAFAGFFLFASLGLPGLAGFIGEFLIFKGAFSLSPMATFFAVGGLILTAIFILKTIQTIFHGPVRGQSTQFEDLSLTERLILWPSVVLVLVLGIWPQLLLGLVNSQVHAFIQQHKL